MPPSYWAEALAAACYLLNRRPSTSIHSEVPYTRLFREQPTYDHLRVFGCLCYPNLQATSAHKLASRSTACVFLGYPSSHKGYRCLDLSTRRIIISRHVIFDESRFPFADGSPAPDSSLLDFLVDDTVNTMPCGPSPAAPAAAPFPEDIEQPPPPPLHAGPGGRGPVPPPGPAASTSLGGRGLVPLPGLLQARPAAPRDAAGLVPALRTSTCVAHQRRLLRRSLYLLPPLSPPGLSLVHSPGRFRVCSTGASPPRLRRPFRLTTAVGWPTQTGVRPWPMSTRP